MQIDRETSVSTRAKGPNARLLKWPSEETSKTRGYRRSGTTGRWQRRMKVQKYDRGPALNPPAADMSLQFNHRSLTLSGLTRVWYSRWPLPKCSRFSSGCLDLLRQQNLKNKIKFRTSVALPTGWSWSQLVWTCVCNPWLYNLREDH